MRLSVIVFALLVTSLAEPAAVAQPTVSVDIHMERPEHHFFQVALTLKGFDQDTIRVAMPVWTPGSYKVREFAQNVQLVTASDGQGRSLPIEKVDKSTWEIERQDSKTVKVSYEVFAYEVSVRTSLLDDRHGYINPASVVMYVVDHLSLPIDVEIHPIWNWYIDTALPARTDTQFRARDYDHLVDSPIEIGTHRRYDFEVRGKPHRFVVFGEGNMDERAMVKDIEKVIEAAADLFGDLPYERYVFITQLLESGGGGLEHHDSTSLQTSAWRFDSERSWRSFLGLVAHEFFHLWNVKRIRDVNLGPFDYSKENYTRLLWVHEGWTVYYADRLLLKAGLMTPKQYRDSNLGRIRGYRRRPGRHVQSLAQSSFDSWIKYYLTNENTSNSTVNYYSHGALAALGFDLIIRENSQGERSLDDVMKALNVRFAKKDQGVTPEDVKKLLLELGGSEVETFWNDHVIGTKEVDFASLMAMAGLVLEEETPQKKDEKERKPWDRPGEVNVDFSTETRGDRLFIRSIPRGSVPWKAGFAMGDELIALGDQRITSGNWSRLLAEHRPGDTVSLLISRHDVLQRRALWLEPDPPGLKLEKAEEATELQKRIYEDWSGEPFEKKKDEKEPETEPKVDTAEGGGH
ncbi:MAG: PDZ domain-containing protein [Planctomycetota bacterium]